MATYRLDLSYDGLGFHGYAIQPDVRTVQGDLERALETVLGDPVATVCAGRTDARVHARHQVVSFSADSAVAPEDLRRRLDSLLGDEIVVTNVAVAGPDFSARFDAAARSYRYRILGRPIGDPLRRNTMWHLPHTLDGEAMHEAASHFIGEHDFASFCRKADGRTSVRTVLSAEWSEPEPSLHEFNVTALAFCHQMVRSMVALCADVGRGRVAPDEVPGIMATRDRNAARGAAPPHGLTLWHVSYEADASLLPQA